MFGFLFGYLWGWIGVMAIPVGEVVQAINLYNQCVRLWLYTRFTRWLRTTFYR